MREVVRGAMVVAGLILAAFSASSAQTTRPVSATVPAANPAVILDTMGSWRIYEVLKPPVIEFDDGIKPVVSGKMWLDKETAPPPADWAKADFADSNWLRGTARSFSRTAYLAALYARGKFEVTDPATVKDLKVSLSFYGGAILYVNGREIARANLPKEAAGPESLAEGYGADAYYSENGAMVPWGWASEGSKSANAARERTLTDIAIPAGALRKGVNVLAVQVIRAPYNKLLADKKNQGKNDEVVGQNCPYSFNWFTCELRRIGMTAGGPSGIASSAGRPKELQAWTSDLLSPDYTSDIGDRCEAGNPVIIKGPKNGWSSGKLVVGSPKAIEGLKVTVGDLKGAGGGVIQASQVRVRYAVPFGSTASNSDDHGNGAALLDSLLESPLDSFPADRFGAVVPVWLTVKAPVDCKAGMYSGQATVEAKGERSLAVPISLDVADYAVPNTQDYKTWIELMQSPDTLAAEYNVPLWSDKHWDMIRESMRYIGEIGSRVLHIPLIAQTNSGNAESMVRYIRRADGKYDFDFSIMDKYLDCAQKYMGEPKFVAFIAWEIYLNAPKNEVTLSEQERGTKDSDWASMEKSWSAARWELRGKGPAVTAVDPATGKTESINLPRFEDPNAKGIWKPLFDELHKRLAARGLEKTMLLGMASDYWPNKDEMTVLQEASGNLPWINHTHGGNFVGAKLNGIATVAYTAYVWNVTYPYALPINDSSIKDANKGRSYGWKRPELYTEFRRFTSLNEFPASTLLLFSEIQITGQQRGVGRIGGDFWPVYKDKQGRRRAYVWERYPQSLWHSCNLFSHMLDPGPTGPVASTRYELMREGMQECEARIAIETVLTDEKLKAKVDPELAARCQQLLDERVWRELKAFSDLQLAWRLYATAANNWYYGSGGTAGHYWYASSGWRDRTQELYRLAAEVTRKLQEK